jgi:hypothetical protein
MHTTIRNPSKAVNSDKIIIGAQWLGDKLMGKKLANNIGIEIIMIPNLRNKKGAYGLFYNADIDNRKKPRQFEIELDSSLSSNIIIQNMCHEMVHVKQTARCELAETLEKTKKLWHGTEICEKKIDYWDLPWEIEAHGRERGLYLRLLDHYDSIGI